MGFLEKVSIIILGTEDTVYGLYGSLDEILPPFLKIWVTFCL